MLVEIGAEPALAPTGPHELGLTLDSVAGNGFSGAGPATPVKARAKTGSDVSYFFERGNGEPDPLRRGIKKSFDLLVVENM